MIQQNVQKTLKKRDTSLNLSMSILVESKLSTSSLSFSLFLNNFTVLLSKKLRNLNFMEVWIRVLKYPILCRIEKLFL